MLFIAQANAMHQGEAMESYELAKLFMKLCFVDFCIIVITLLVGAQIHLAKSFSLFLYCVVLFCLV